MAVGWALARGVTRPVRRLEDGREPRRAWRSRDASARAARPAGAPAPRAGLQSDGLGDRPPCSTPNSSSSPMPRISSARRSPRSGSASRTSTLGSTPASVPAVEAVIADVTRLSRLVDGLLVLARDDGHRRAPEPIDVAAVAPRAWRSVERRRRPIATCDLIVERHRTRRGRPSRRARSSNSSTTSSTTRCRSRAPGGTVTIRVLARGTRSVELHVLDDGPGLDAREREPARSIASGARPTRRREDPGLGLAIVRRLAEASGGTARLDDRPDGGIDAVVTLPRDSIGHPRPKPRDRDSADDARSGRWSHPAE